MLEVILLVNFSSQILKPIYTFYPGIQIQLLIKLNTILKKEKNVKRRLIAVIKNSPG